MTIEIINALDEDGTGHVDIKYNGEIIASVDAHGKPPSVGVYETSRPEDAFAHFRFDEDGDIDVFDL